MIYRKCLKFVLAGLAILAVSEQAQAQNPNSQWRTSRRMTQVTVLPTPPTAALIQPNPAAQKSGRWTTNRPLISSGYEMPTRPLFISGYAGRNYGHGVRQGYIFNSPGTAQGELKMIELKPIR